MPPHLFYMLDRVKFLSFRSVKSALLIPSFAGWNSSAFALSGSTLIGLLSQPTVLMDQTQNLRNVASEFSVRQLSWIKLRIYEMWHKGTAPNLTRRSAELFWINVKIRAPNLTWGSAELFLDRCQNKGSEGGCSQEAVRRRLFAVWWRPISANKYVRSSDLMQIQACKNIVHAVFI